MANFGVQGKSNKGKDRRGYNERPVKIMMAETIIESLESASKHEYSLTTLNKYVGQARTKIGEIGSCPKAIQLLKRVHAVEQSIQSRLALTKLSYEQEMEARGML